MFQRLVTISVFLFATANVAFTQPDTTVIVYDGGVPAANHDGALNVPGAHSPFVLHQKSIRQGSFPYEFTGLRAITSMRQLFNTPFGRIRMEAALEHFKPILISVFNAGMRLQEVLGLKWDMVKLWNMGARSSWSMIRTGKNATFH